MFCPKCTGSMKKYQAAHECERCKNRWFIINTFEPRPVPVPAPVIEIQEEVDVINWINEGGR